MFHRLRLTGLLVVPCALVLATTVSSPALAAGTATVSGSVVNSEAAPIRGISVYVTKNGTTFTYVGATRTDGTFVTNHGVKVPTGSQKIVFVDDSGDYASTYHSASLGSGDNVQAQVELERGSSVSGTISAPSGKLLKNVGVVVSRNNTDPVDLDYGYDKTFSNGTFEAGPVGSGAFKVYLSTDGYKVSRRTLAVPGEQAQVDPENPIWSVQGQDVTNVRVPVTIKATYSRPSKGRLTFRLAVSASTYGLSAPGGAVTVYDQSKAVKSNVKLSSSGKATISLKGLRRGNRTFKIKFLGAQDTLASSVSGKIKVL